MLIKKLKEVKAFTLIELMFVLAIIMISMSIAIPQFIAYNDRNSNDTIEIITQDQENSSIPVPSQKSVTSEKGENKKL